MFLESGIQHFFEDVESKIYHRGEDYYRSGHVESIDWNGSHVTAEVSGSEEEPYLVELDFSADGEIEGWSCDCPYDWGPVCKHIVAVLLAIRAEPPKEMPEKKTGSAIDIRSLVEKAKKEQLAALVLGHCQEDPRFQSWVLSELEDSGEQELTAIKAIIKDSIRSNKRQGFIDMRGCDNICADLDDALDQARRRIKRGQCDRGLDIALFVFLTAVKLAGEADSSSGSLGWTVDAALETVELAANSLARNGEPRGKFVRKILEMAEGPAFDGWDHWRYELLRRAAVLADEENEKQFYILLDNLSDRFWETFQDTPRYGYEKEDKVTRYYIMSSAHGTEEARSYLERNLEVDELRLVLIREDMATGNYANAERLCRERLEKEQAEQWVQPSQWQYLLYEIYRDWGRREEHISQARKLALLGDQDFYQTAKDLLTEAGRWQETYPGFLAELKTARPAYEYMEILKLEGEAALLMEQVRLYPETVFQYAGMLARQYAKEVVDLCTAVIRKQSEQVNNRREYRELCGLLDSLARLGGQAEARTLITELRHAYPRRPALLEELRKVEQVLAQKHAEQIL